MNDRISISADGKETLLCDWTDSVQEGADVAPSSEVQVVKYFRGEAAKAFDRMNESTTLNLIVTREWADEVKAFDAWITCRTNTPRKGNVTWRTRNGRSAVARYLLNAVVQVKPVARLGVVTRIQYTLFGGKISTTPPVAS